jgi:alpha-aminoadipate/glutamate carrier protein LysW
MAVCPECEAEVEIDELDVDQGDVISCPECGSDVRVVGVSPVELDRASGEVGEWIT